MLASIDGMESRLTLRDRRPSSSTEDLELPELPAEYVLPVGVPRGISHEQVPVAKLLNSLARFARSLGFYAPSNRTLGLFFDRLCEEFDAYFADHGDITLGIDPAAFYLRDELVYEDRDREQSAPFRLFRDGVRLLTIQRDVPREELFALAKILGARLTGVNRRGDDLQMRLWHADFQHITYQGIEGFVHELYTRDEEDGGARYERERELPRLMRRIHGTLPFDEMAAPAGGGDEIDHDEEPSEASIWVDHDAGAGVYPGRAHYDLEVDGPDVEMALPLLTGDEREAVRAALRRERVDSLTRMLEHALFLFTAQPGFFTVEDIQDLIHDGQRYLLGEGRVAELADVVRLLVRVGTSGEYAEQTAALAGKALQGLARSRSARKVVAALPPGDAGVAQLRRYLEAMGDTLAPETLLAVLRFELPDPVRRVLVQRCLDRVDRDIDWLREQQRSAEVLDVLTVMELLAATDTDEARAELTRTALHPRAEVRLQYLWLVSGQPPDPDTGRAVGRLVLDPAPDVRDAAVDVARRRRDPETTDALIELAERPGFGRLPAPRREALLRAVAACGGEDALPWLQDHIRRVKKLALLTPAQAAWNEAGLAALTEIGGPRVRALLADYKESGDETFRRWALKAYLEVARRDQAPDGGRDDG